MPLTIDHRNQNSFVTAEAINSTLVDVLVIVTNTSSCQSVTSPFCHISSLEVYRGMEEAIKINHGGFSLSDKGTIQVVNITSTCTTIVACMHFKGS